VGGQLLLGSMMDTVPIEAGGANPTCAWRGF
jgi:hypothetical protein